MNGVARITYSDVLLMLPSTTPYELEEVVESVAWHAKRHGPLRVEVNRHEWLMRAPDEGAQCDVCHAPQSSVAVASGPALCVRCARRELASPPTRARPAPAAA